MSNRSEKKKRYIVDEYISIDEISFVDKGANKKKFSIMKSKKEGGEEIMAKDQEIKKTNSEVLEPKDLKGSDVVSATQSKEVIAVSTGVNADGEVQYKDVKPEIDSAEIARLSAEAAEEERKIEELRNQKVTLESAPYPEIDVTKITDEATVMAIENQKLEIQKLRLQREQLEKEIAELKANQGYPKGFQRQFNEDLLKEDTGFDKDREEMEAIAKDKDGNLGDLGSVMNGFQKKLVQHSGGYIQ